MEAAAPNHLEPIIGTDFAHIVPHPHKAITALLNEHAHALKAKKDALTPIFEKIWKIKTGKGCFVDG